MFNEYEIATFLEDEQVVEAVKGSKKEFISEEAKFLEINDHDFLSLIMMTPCVGIAKANGTVSLFEELALNKMARKMSKGGYFLKMDPVAHAMKYLIKHFDLWEPKFFKIIELCMDKSCDLDEIRKQKADLQSDDPFIDFANHLITIPYGFHRFLTAFFIHDEHHIIKERSVSKVEFEKMKDIGMKMGLEGIPVYDAFMRMFKLK